MAPAKVPVLIQTLYQRLNPRVHAPLDGFQGLGGNSMGEVGIRTVLFGGNGIIETKPGGLRLDFRTLRTFDDLQMTIDCALLAHEAISAVNGGLQIEPTTIRCHSWIRGEPDEASATALLETMNKPTQLVLPSQVGAQSAKHSCRREYSNDQERWDLSIQLDTSALKSAHMFLVFTVTFRVGCKIAALAEQIPFAQQNLLRLLALLGLEPLNPPPAIRIPHA